jgi:murein DD-endopeptidase MepM/ murein hydrolase activator NlpD
VVVPQSEDVAVIAAGLVQRLKAHGVAARPSRLEDAGRPDTLLLLGAGSGTGSTTWYCDPGPALSAGLAQALLRSDPARLQPADASEPQTSLACEEVHAGRARVPAVLDEVPVGFLVSNRAVDVTLDNLAGAINRFLLDNSAAVREARNAARLAWPANGPITSSFGPSHPLGIDIGQWQGNITAATDGTVVFAGGDPCCGYGRYVVIQSRGGIETLYAHLDTLAVRKGQRIRQGQALGTVGCTGRCFGRHLHFEVTEGGLRQNPMLYLP